MSRYMNLTIVEVQGPDRILARETPGPTASAETVEYASFFKEMNNYFNNGILTFEIYFPKPNEICVAQNSQNNRWHRVRVEEILITSSGHKANCFFLDTGGKQLIRVVKIQKIPKRFLTVPFQVKVFALYGLKPLSLVVDPTLTVFQIPCKKWDASAAVHIKKLINCASAIQAVIKSRGEASELLAMIYLTFSSNGEILTLNEELINKGYAIKDPVINKSFGEETRNFVQNVFQTNGSLSPKAEQHDHPTPKFDSLQSLNDFYKRSKANDSSVPVQVSSRSDIPRINSSGDFGDLSPISSGSSRNSSFLDPLGQNSFSNSEECRKIPCKSSSPNPPSKSSVDQPTTTDAGALNQLLFYHKKLQQNNPSIKESSLKPSVNYQMPNLERENTFPAAESPSCDPDMPVSTIESDSSSTSEESEMSYGSEEKENNAISPSVISTNPTKTIISKVSPVKTLSPDVSSTLTTGNLTNFLAYHKKLVNSNQDAAPTGSAFKTLDHSSTISATKVQLTVADGKINQSPNNYPVSNSVQITAQNKHPNTCAYDRQSVLKIGSCKSLQPVINRSSFTHQHSFTDSDYLDKSHCYERKPDLPFRRVESKYDDMSLNCNQVKQSPHIPVFFESASNNSKTIFGKQTNMPFSRIQPEDDDRPISDIGLYYNQVKKCPHIPVFFESASNNSKNIIEKQTNMPFSRIQPEDDDRPISDIGLYYDQVKKSPHIPVFFESASNNSKTIIEKQTNMPFSRIQPEDDDRPISDIGLYYDQVKKSPHIPVFFESASNNSKTIIEKQTNIPFSRIQPEDDDRPLSALSLYCNQLKRKSQNVAAFSESESTNSENGKPKFFPSSENLSSTNNSGVSTKGNVIVNEIPRIREEVTANRLNPDSVHLTGDRCNNEKDISSENEECKNFQSNSKETTFPSSHTSLTTSAVTMLNFSVSSKLLSSSPANAMRMLQGLNTLPLNKLNTCENGNASGSAFSKKFEIFASIDDSDLSEIEMDNASNSQTENNSREILKDQTRNAALSDNSEPLIQLQELSNSERLSDFCDLSPVPPFNPEEETHTFGFQSEIRSIQQDATSRKEDSIFNGKMEIHSLHKIGNPPEIVTSNLKQNVSSTADIELTPSEIERLRNENEKAEKAESFELLTNASHNATFLWASTNPNVVGKIPTMVSNSTNCFKNAPTNIEACQGKLKVNILPPLNAFENEDNISSVKTTARNGSNSNQIISRCSSEKVGVFKINESENNKYNPFLKYFEQSHGNNDYFSPVNFVSDSGFDIQSISTNLSTAADNEKEAVCANLSSAMVNEEIVQSTTVSSAKDNAAVSIMDWPSAGYDKEMASENKEILSFTAMSAAENCREIGLGLSLSSEVDNAEISGSTGVSREVDNTEISPSTDLLFEMDDAEIEKSTVMSSKVNKSKIELALGFSSEVDNTEILGSTAFSSEVENTEIVPALCLISEVNNTDIFGSHFDSSEVDNTEVLVPTVVSYEGDNTEILESTGVSTEVDNTEVLVPTVVSYEGDNTEILESTGVSTEVDNTEVLIPTVVSYEGDNTEILESTGVSSEVDNTEILESTGVSSEVDNTEILESTGVSSEVDNTEILESTGVSSEVDNTEILESTGVSSEVDNTEILESTGVSSEVDNTEILESTGVSSEVDNTEILESTGVSSEMDNTEILESTGVSSEVDNTEILESTGVSSEMDNTEILESTGVSSEVDNTEILESTGVSSEVDNTEILESTGVSSEVDNTEILESTGVSSEMDNTEILESTGVSSEVDNTEILESTGVSSDMDNTEILEATGVSSDMDNTEIVPAFCLSSEVGNMDIFGFHCVSSEVDNTEILRSTSVTSDMDNTEILGSTVVSSKVENTEIVPALCLSSEVDITDIFGPNCVSSEVDNIKILGSNCVSSEVDNTKISGSTVVSSGVDNTEILGSNGVFSEVDNTEILGSTGVFSEVDNTEILESTGVFSEVDNTEILESTGVFSEVDNTEILESTGVFSEVDNTEILESTGVSSEVDNTKLELTGLSSEVDNTEIAITGLLSEVDNTEIALTGLSSEIDNTQISPSTGASSEMDNTKILASTGVSLEVDTTDTSPSSGKEISAYSVISSAVDCDQAVECDVYNPESAYGEVISSSPLLSLIEHNGISSSMLVDIENVPTSYKNNIEPPSLMKELVPLNASMDSFSKTDNENIPRVEDNMKSIQDACLLAMPALIAMSTDDSNSELSSSENEDSVSKSSSVRCPDDTEESADSSVKDLPDNKIDFSSSSPAITNANSKMPSLSHINNETEGFYSLTPDLDCDRVLHSSPSAPGTRPVVPAVNDVSGVMFPELSDSVSLSYPVRNELDNTVPVEQCVGIDSCKNNELYLDATHAIASSQERQSTSASMIDENTQTVSPLNTLPCLPQQGDMKLNTNPAPVSPEQMIKAEDHSSNSVVKSLNVRDHAMDCIRGRRILEKLGVTKKANMTQKNYVQSTTTESILLNDLVLFVAETIPNPIYNLQEFGVPEALSQLTENLNIHPTPIQAYSWGPALRGKNIVGISPLGSGKTWAYVVPILASLCQYNIYSDIKFNNGPFVLILVSTWTKAISVYKQCKHISQSNREIIVEIIYGGGEESKKSVNLLNGCHILVATLPCFKRMLDSKFTSLDRLCHLVIDDADILLQDFYKEIVDLMCKYKNVVESRDKGYQRHQVMAYSSKWTSYIKGFVKNAIRDPVIIITDMMEAAIYGGVKQIPIMCEESDQKDQLLKLVPQILKKGEKVIVFSLDDDCFEVQNLLIQHLQIPVAVACNSFYKSELKIISTEWKMPLSENEPYRLLVSSDKALFDLLINDATCVVHYRMPKKKIHIGLRIQTMSNYYQHYQDDEPPVKIVKSYMLILPENKKQVKSLRSFLMRSINITNKETWDFLSNIRQDEDFNPEIKLCLNLKAFGKCRNKHQCNDRHCVVPSVDLNGTSPQHICLPTQGDVRVKILHVKTTNNFYVRILEHKNGLHKSIQNHTDLASLIMEMAFYYNNHSNRRVLDELKVGTLCVVNTSEQFSRVKVVKPYDNASKNTASLFFVDIGKLESHPICNLYQLADEFKTIPFQAVEVFLCRLRPVDFDTEWTPASNSFAESWLESKIFYGKIRFVMDNTLWLDPLLRRTFLKAIKTVTNGPSLRRELISNNLAVDNPQHLIQLHQLFEGYVPKLIPLDNRQSSCSSWEFLLENETLQTLADDYEDVVISYIFNPEHFYVQKMDMKICFNDLMMKIEEKMNVETEQQQKRDWLVGMHCLSKSLLDSRWYRVIILTLLDSNAVVHFVDYGNIEEVPIDELRTIPRELMYLPSQAIECKLAHIKPFEDQWSAKCNDMMYYMTQTADNVYKTLALRVVSEIPTDGKLPQYCVTLLDTSYERVMNIGQELVWWKMAAPNDDHFQVLFPEQQTQQMFYPSAGKIADMCAILYSEQTSSQQYDQLMTSYLNVCLRHPDKLVEENVPECLLKLFSYTHNAEMFSSVLEYIKLLMAKPSLYGNLLSCGILQNLGQILKMQDDESVLHKTFRLIQFMIKIDSTLIKKITSLKSGLFSIMCEILKSFYANEIKISVCQLLESFCLVDKKCSENLIQLQVCPILLPDVLEMQDHDLTEAYLSLLDPLSQLDSGLIAIKREKPIEEIMKIIETAKCEKCVSKCLLALKRLSNQNRKNKTLLLELNAVAIFSSCQNLLSGTEAATLCQELLDGLVIKVHHNKDDNRVSICSQLQPTNERNYSVLWCQNRFRILITVKVAKSEWSDCKFQKTSLHFSLISNDGIKQSVNYELFDEVVVEKCAVCLQNKEVIISLCKTEVGYWPRLLQDKFNKPSNLCVDFDKIESDDSDSDSEEVEADEKNPFTLQVVLKDPLIKLVRKKLSSDEEEVPLPVDPAESDDDSLENSDFEEYDRFNIFNTK